MRVLLFFPQADSSYRPMYAPLGIMSIASYLNAKGHSAVISTNNAAVKDIKKTILFHDPDIVGISVISFSYIKNAVKISRIAKALSKPVVWGGGMASAIPELILKSGYADYVSLQEGEQTWLELADAFDKNESFDRIKGLAYIKDGVMIQTEPQPLLDLTCLPKLDWTLIDPEQYLTPIYGCKKSLNIYWSKGCFGSCTFCYNTRFHCSKRRQRPLSHVIEEMKFLIDNYGVDGFEFTDDLLFENTAQMREFCNALIDSQIRISWTGYERIGIIRYQEDYELLYRSGCRCLMFGIETGSKKMQKRLNKCISEEKMISDIEMCHRSGIIPLCTFMIGLPGETSADLHETVNLLKKCGHYMVGLNIFTPQPGTLLYDELVTSQKMQPLRSLKQCMRVRWGDKQYVNVSGIPKRELHTVDSYYRLKGLFFQHDVSPDKHFIDTVHNVAKALKSYGPVGLFLTGMRIIFALMQFSRIFFHPFIRKKYGLYFGEKTV